MYAREESGGPDGVSKGTLGAEARRGPFRPRMDTQGGPQGRLERGGCAKE